MASVYKKGRDKGKKRSPYYIDYFDRDGERRTVKGPTDKGQAEQFAAKLENDAMLRRSGIIDPKLEELAQRRKSSVDDNLLEFEKALKRGKTTLKHVRLTMARVRTVVNGCGFKVLGDIDAEAAEKFIGTFCDENGFGHKTYNHYCQGFEQFCKWLTNSRKVASNPVPKIPRLNCAVDVRKKRRALTVEEQGKLVESARSSGEMIQCYDGETRARIYVLSYMTGLRRSELAGLTPSSFDLNAGQPTVSILATISKHRRPDLLPLHPELVPMLRGWLAGMNPDQLLFPKLAKRRTWLMVKRDLERVGIPYTTAEGDADFHAAGRHTHITQLFRSGATLTQARQLARHSDIKTTMGYTHIGMEDQAKALAALPVACQHIVSSSAVPGVPQEAEAVTESRSEGPNQADASPCLMAPSDIKKHKRASDDSDAQKWRRRERDTSAPTNRRFTPYFTMQIPVSGYAGKPGF